MFMTVHTDNGPTTLCARSMELMATGSREPGTMLRAALAKRRAQRRPA
jgi:hypothetical protein